MDNKTNGKEPKPVKYQELPDDVWEDDQEAESVTATVQPQHQPSQQIQQLPNRLQEIAARKQQQLSTVTEILRPHPLSNPNLRNLPLVPFAVIGAITLLASCMGTTALIISATPNSQITRQQEVLGALAAETQRPEPRCFGFCPAFVGADTSRLATQGSSVGISSGVQDPTQQVEAQETPTVAPSPVDAIEPQIILYNPANTRYKEWFNWYATRSPSEIAMDANSLTDLDCNADPDRCVAMNTVKRQRNL